MSTPAVCEINQCGVLAIGRCHNCGLPFCGSHQASGYAGTPIYSNECAPCNVKLGSPIDRMSRAGMKLRESAGATTPETTDESNSSFEDLLNSQRAKLSRVENDAQRQADEQAAKRASDRNEAAERAQALLPQVESAVAELRQFVPIDERIYLGYWEGTPTFDGGYLYGRSGFLRKPVLARIRFGLHFLNWKRSYITEGWQIGSVRVPFDGIPTTTVHRTADFASYGLNWNNEPECSLDELARLGTYSFTAPVYDYDARSPSGSELVTVRADKRIQEFIASAAKIIAELERRVLADEPLYPPTKRR
ncbi:hypothetical protein QCN29_09840 [Streptomyces sp. HNM0663]|uniref:AN1-type domain-containing protein n=1 Tax=Streptomyces chengmaiensis TaxID=3040919 RepID=A0ABT6HLC4_9ACTN|nr:hypothetical protein [Streptomyces chengmaiensis]MDH2389087.1 hypothetical protein [Streptomyces chengmaiensis]